MPSRTFIACMCAVRVDDGADPALAQARLVQGPAALVRYKRLSCGGYQWIAKARLQFRQALATMERISASTLPAGYSFDWTGTALQEKAASGQTPIVLGLAVLFAYLFLVALYESWNIRCRCCCQSSSPSWGRSVPWRGRPCL